MTYHDYYLSVPTEADMPEIPEGASLDVVGIWHEYDTETETSVPVDGWHFNVRSQEPIEWPASVTNVVPKTPWRVWAG